MLRVDLADFLRGRGHDVVRASESGHERADDAAILEKAIQQNRILITIDKHFGDWVVLPLSQHCGVIRVEAVPTSTENVAKVLLPLLKGKDHPDFRNRLVIASSTRARWIDTGR